MGFLKEFRDFAMRGNLVDLAVGFVMGAAFGKVTNVFINGIVMPFVGLIQGKDLSDWKLVLKPAETSPDGKQVAEVAVQYGNFISVVIEFVIIAFVMFLIVKAMNAAKKKLEAAPAPAAPPSPSNEEKLLTEIRDLLKNNR
ncbi:MAG: large-conductance mechanosensitive channel protein MscL [Cytophagales bacterium]|nr:large-conductance mechanosensitive channel protein MscL [Bernardetiaceae bacterium]MDW8210398.1 large-conductance mechanosensitive channel protein MscL [Cytophagales bacterium]